MGVFSRLGDIINSNINAVLEKAEDPEKIIRLMIQEMEDTLVELRSSAAKCIAEKKERTRLHTRHEKELLEWERKAELALDKDREDLAKAALMEKRHIEQRTDAIHDEVKLLEDQLARFNDDIGRLQAKLQDAKNRQRSLVMRQKHATTTLKAREQVHSDKIEDIMFRFESAERRIEDVEARSEVMEMGRRPRNVADEIDDLVNDEQVADDLAALKAKRSKAAKPTKVEPKVEAVANDKK